MREFMTPVDAIITVSVMQAQHTDPGLNESLLRHSLKH